MPVVFLSVRENKGCREFRAYGIIRELGESRVSNRSWRKAAEAGKCLNFLNNRENDTMKV